MSIFDQYHDTPEQIINEGEQITVSLKRNGSSGTINWTIPKSTGGCGSLSVYDGALITIDTTSTTVDKFPVDGRKYVADPSANPEMHLGDKIGTALVIGYVDKDTDNIVVSDLNTEIPYFVSLHAISNIQTYHSAGVHSYSLPITGLKTPNTTAIQNIRVGVLDVGVSITDPTNLPLSKVYELKVVTDYDKPYQLEFDSNTIQTYQQLIDQINKQAMLLDSPLQSPVIPNTGLYYYIPNTHECFMWNGTQLVSNKVQVHDDAPDVLSVGQYWFNPETKIMYISNNVGNWVPANYITRQNPPDQIDCGYFWFNGNMNVLYMWNGTIWIVKPLLVQNEDPNDQFKLDCNSYWFNENTSELMKLDKCCSRWSNTLAIYSPNDPHTPTISSLWLDDSRDKLFKWNGTIYVEQVVLVGNTTPTNLIEGQYWYNPTSMKLYEKLDIVTTIEVMFLMWDKDPTVPLVGELWWNSTNDVLSQWDGATNAWVVVDTFIIDEIDPLTYTLDVGTMWTVDNILYKSWDGSEWNNIDVTNSSVDPHNLIDGTLWFDGSSFFTKLSSDWIGITPLLQTYDPYMPTLNDFWFNTSTNELTRFNGTVWEVILFSNTSLVPSVNYVYYNTSLNKLMRWNGYGWVDGEPKFSARLSDNGQYITLESSLTGSYARIEVPYGESLTSTSYQPVHNNPSPIFVDMVPSATPMMPRKGGDGLQGNPSYMQLGVGTDGTVDERRELIDSLRMQLGYPTVEVELTKQQFNAAIDNAFDTLRTRSGMAYKRGFYFMKINPLQQQYIMTDRKLGYNKIVSIMKMHRVTSAFLSNPEGQGVYGQMALQHMYQMGSFDLISYHLVAQYMETMEQLFATNIMFDWNEDERKLSIFKQFHKPERVLIEVTVERTEQDMLKDRYLKNWIERFAMCQSRLILADIRGKYGSLPGSGGGVTLNSNDLSSRADMEMVELMDQLDTHVINNPEEWGLGSALVSG